MSWMNCNYFRQVPCGSQALFNMGQNESEAAFRIMQNLRDHEIACELYHEPAKMDKQFRYAERKTSGSL